VATRYGWRWVFAVTPVLASLWIVVWLWLYKKPRQHPRLTDAERAYLAANLEPAAPEASGADATDGARWRQVLQMPEVWRLLVARLLTDQVWYFYQFWMPKYLHTARGLSQASLSILWVVFLAADVGFILGGLSAGRLIKHGLQPIQARLRTMLVCAMLVPLSFTVPFMPTLGFLVAVCMVIACAATAWLNNVTSLVVDVIPKPMLGTAFGLVACGSTVGGFLMNEGVGWLAAHHAYDVCFSIMALVHPLALLVLLGLADKKPAC
jgi:MFS transporter, ACS family, hexuronate transporter